MSDITTKFKGQFKGLCNITACQSPHKVVWWNRGSYAYYCEGCAQMLNRVNRQAAEELLGKGGKLCVAHTESQRKYPL